MSKTETSIAVYHCYPAQLPTGVLSPAELMAYLDGRSILNVGNTFYYSTGLRGSWHATPIGDCVEIPADHALSYTSTAQRGMRTQRKYVKFLCQTLAHKTPNELRTLARRPVVCRCALRNFCPAECYVAVMDHLLT